VTGADNQQERLRVAGWITGFVDGEGCFAVPMHRNPTSSVGWQVQPQFVVVQSASSVRALEALRDYFGCGRINVNRRRDNHREPLYRYIVGGSVTSMRSSFRSSRRTGFGRQSARTSTSSLMFSSS
jgi:hypothetical protein